MESMSGRLLTLPLLSEQLGDLLDCGRVLGPLVCRLSLTQLKLREPAWYFESGRLTTTPSSPWLMESRSVLVRTSTESVLMMGAGSSTVDPAITSSTMASRSS